MININQNTSLRYSAIFLLKSSLFEELIKINVTENTILKNL